MRSSSRRSLTRRGRSRGCGARRCGDGVGRHVHAFDSACARGARSGRSARGLRARRTRRDKSPDDDRHRIARLVAPNVLSLTHWDRLLDGELYASSTRLDWRTLSKRTFDIDLRVRVAPSLRCGGRLKAHRTRARHRPGRHRQDARRAQAPPRPARRCLSLTDRPRDTSRLGAPASRARHQPPWNFALPRTKPRRRSTALLRRYRLRRPTLRREGRRGGPSHSRRAALREEVT